jgi:hypothetical protein
MPPLPEPIPELPELSNSPVSNSYITPPVGAGEPSWQTQSVLVTAIHVLTTEASALSHLAHLYKTNPVAQSGFIQAVDAIARTVHEGGKLVICGVGKSGKIGKKLVATMNSLGIMTVFLHPIEALHGDLGVIRPVSMPLFFFFFPSLLTGHQ